MNPTNLAPWGNETQEEFVERVKRREKALELRPPKEKPLRTIESPSGIVYLVEWLCPACKGKGCKVCKHKGVVDSVGKAHYERPEFQDRKRRSWPCESSPSDLES